jgi:hypothetical protein
MRSAAPGRRQVTLLLESLSTISRELRTPITSIRGYFASLSTCRSTMALTNTHPKHRCTGYCYPHGQQLFALPRAVGGMICGGHLRSLPEW